MSRVSAAAIILQYVPTSTELIIVVDAPAINAELSRLRAMDKEREKAHNQKFKGDDFVWPTLPSLTQVHYQVS